METSRVAGVYIRQADFLVEAMSQTVTGLWVGSGPVRGLPRTATAAELGLAIRQALLASQRGVPHPTDWGGVLTELLRVAGIRSWNALQKSAAYCGVEADPNGIHVVPHENGGTRGPNRGYTPITDAAISLPGNATDNVIGDGLLSAIEACR